MLSEAIREVECPVSYYVQFTIYNVQSCKNEKRFSHFCKNLCGAYEARTRDLQRDRLAF